MLLNLHCHLEGCVRPDTAVELAHELGLPEPDGGWENAFLLKGSSDLTRFLWHVAQAYPLLGTANALRRVAFEAVQDAATDGQSYIELRLGPGTHSRPGFSVRQVLEAVCEGVSDAVGDTGIHAGVIACMLRHEPQELVEEIAQAAISLAGSGIVGLDIAGDELLFPSVERFAPLYRRAHDAGLGLTAHAAEAGPASAARDVVALLGVTRIGHGSHIVDDLETLEWIRLRDVTIEVCPTSNVLTGAAKSLATHPVHSLLRAGIPVALGDDNPQNTGIRLKQESILLVNEGGLSKDTVDGFAHTAIAAAFCTENDRDELTSLLQKEGTQ